MFDYLKEKIKSAASYIPPTAYAAGRLFSSMGQTFYSLVNFFKNIPLGPNFSIIQSVITYGAVSAGFVLGLATRVPPLYHHYIKQKPKAKTSTLKIEHSGPQTFSELGIIAKGSYLWIVGVGSAGSAFMALGSYLGGVTLGEKIGELLNSDVHDEGWREAAIQVAALYFVACTLMSYRTFNFNRLKQRAWEAAVNIDNRKMPWTKEAKITLAISTVGIVASTSYAYFTTYGAVAKIPLITIPSYIQRGLAIGGSTTMLTNQLAVYMPAVYDTFTRNKIPKNHRQPIWETPASGIVYIAGGIDAAATGASFYTGISHTLQTELSIDPNKYYIIVPSILCASGSAILNFAFSVRDGWQNTMKIYYERQGEISYDQLPSSPSAASDLIPRAGILSDSRYTMFTNSNHDLIFQFNDAELDDPHANDDYDTESDSDDIMQKSLGSNV